MSYKSKYTGPQIDDILDSVEGKQNEIEDLDSIRAGAAKGATALQSYTEKYTGTVTGIKINGETKSGSGVIDLGTISTDISGKVDKVAGKQLSTEDFTTALKNKLEGLNNYDDTELSNALSTLRGDFDELVSGDTTTAIKTFNEVIAFLDGLTDTQDLESIIASIEQQIAGKMDKVTLAKVATSGSYNDLSNKPTIPAAVTESTVSGWGFTKNAGTYSKPSGGIPKSDLASAVQTSLGKADTALQSYTEQYKGTVTGVKINGETKSPANGIVDLGTINESTNDYTFTEVSGNEGYYVKAEIGDTGNPYYDNVYIPLLERDDSTPNAPTTRIGSCSGFFTSDNELRLSSDGLQCSSVYANGPNFTITSNGSDNKFLAGNGKYRELKTINGQSIIGSGNITISGGSSGANIQAVDTGDVLDDVTVDYATKTYVDELVGDINSILESIINGGGGVVKMITFTVNGTEYQAEEGMTWSEWVDSEYNTSNYIVNDYFGGITNKFETYIISDGSKFVLPSDIINKDYVYYHNTSSPT